MMIDFCLPAKNEEAILERSARLLEAYLRGICLPASWKIVIIVNGTSDKSREIAEELERENSSVFKSVYLQEEGKGMALKKYFNESAADILVFMDTDLATSLENIPALLEPIFKDDADLVAGSRLLADSKIVRKAMRVFVSKAYNSLSRLILNHGFRDLQCGFKAFKKEVYDRTKPWLQDNRWFFDTEFVVLAKLSGYRVKEIPVEWQENRFITRKSKIKIIQDSWTFLKNLIFFRIRLFKIKKYLRNA